MHQRDAVGVDVEAARLGDRAYQVDRFGGDIAGADRPASLAAFQAEEGLAGAVRRLDQVVDEPERSPRGARPDLASHELISGVGLPCHKVSFGGVRVGQFLTGECVEAEQRHQILKGNPGRHAQGGCIKPVLDVVASAAAFQPVDDLFTAEPLGSFTGADGRGKGHMLPSRYRPLAPHADRRATHPCEVGDVLHGQRGGDIAHGASSLQLQRHPNSSGMEPLLYQMTPRSRLISVLSYAGATLLTLSTRPDRRTG
jgi:hypothetical protein